VLGARLTPHLLEGFPRRVQSALRIEELVPT
jgi:hypothetical protein